MNLRQIIRESINSVILDSIIDEAITNEVVLNEGRPRANKNRGYRNAGNRKQQQNLQQKRQQNARQQQTRTQTQSQGNQPANNENWYSQTPPPEQAQAGYGYQNSEFDDTRHNAPVNNTNPQVTPQQNQQTTPKPTADFSQYSNELKKLVGGGIDPKPVQNNEAATQYIETFNQFVFSVINAIDNGNISPNGNANNGRNGSAFNPYAKDKTDIGMDASKGVVNYLGNGAETVLGYGDNNPFKGVIKAGVDTYNKDHDALTQYMNNKKYGNAANEIPSNAPLTVLMTETYPNLYSQYQQIDGTNNNIFGATPVVLQCHQVLQNLSTAVTNYMNSLKQQQNQQQQGKQQATNNNNKQETPENNTGEKSNTNETAPDYNYTNAIRELKELNFKCREITNNTEINENVANTAGWVSYLLGHVAQSFENNVYFSKDVKNNGIEPLTQLLSLDGNNDDNLVTLNTVSGIYDKEYEIYKDEPNSKEMKALKVVYKSLNSLTRLKEQLKSNGIYENNNNR